MEYTNKDLLIAARKELLRRKALVDKIIDFFEYDRNVFDISTLSFTTGYHKNCAAISIDYFVKKIKNPFYYDKIFIEEFDEDKYISIGNVKRMQLNFSDYDIPLEFSDNNNIIIPKEKIEEYLEYIEYLKTQMPLMNKKHSFDSSNIALGNNNPYRTIYRSCNDSLDINNDENNRSVDLCFFEELLNTTIDESQYTDYMLGLIEDSVKKDIIFDENNSSLRKKSMNYTINEENNSLVLKRTRKVSYLPVAKNTCIPVKHY